MDYHQLVQLFRAIYTSIEWAKWIICIGNIFGESIRAMHVEIVYQYTLHSQYSIVLIIYLQSPSQLYRTIPSSLMCRRSINTRCSGRNSQRKHVNNSSMIFVLKMYSDCLYDWFYRNTIPIFLKGTCFSSLCEWIDISRN